MASNTLVINVDIAETRVALIEQGKITELFLERERERSPVGNVYLGRVTRVLPGMQAAFIEIGLDRAAFLHVEDVVVQEDMDELLEREESDDADAAAAVADDEDEAGNGDGDERAKPKRKLTRKVSRSTPIR